MAQNFIEHVNLTVSDPDRTSAMLQALFGWRERWRGPGLNDGRTIHVGNDHFYIAAYTPKHGLPSERVFEKGVPLNHVGIVVDDLDDVERRVEALGLKPFSHGDYEPGRRFYFFDHDGIEFEIVSYAPAAPAKKKRDHQGFARQLAKMGQALMAMQGFRHPLAE